MSNRRDADNEDQVLAVDAVVEKIRQLSVRQLDASDPHDNGRTALHWAVQFGHTKVVRALLSVTDAQNHGVDINARTYDLETPLGVATPVLSAECVQCLVPYRAIDHRIASAMLMLMTGEAISA